MKGVQNAERFMIASDNQGAFGRERQYGKMGMIDQAQPIILSTLLILQVKL